MSKKKAKPAARKAPNQRGKAAPRPAARPRGPRVTGHAGRNRTVYATIYIFRTSNGTRIRTAPQRLFANPGDRIEWTVVNMVDGSDVPVTLTWPESGPFGREPIAFRSTERLTIGARKAGRFKYVVSALDAQEDPEIDIPDI